MTLPWRARMVTAPASCFWSTSFWTTECRFSSRSLEKPTDSGLAVGRSAAVLRAMLCRTRMRDRFILGALLYIKRSVHVFRTGDLPAELGKRSIHRPPVAVLEKLSFGIGALAFSARQSTSV